MLISGTDALNEFREKYTGGEVLRLLRQERGGLLVRWEVGVGKSFNLDQLVAAAIEQDSHDLVVVLLPTREVLDERAWIRQPPAGVPIVNLKPRPRKQCGALDGQWVFLERRDMALLGRMMICRICPHVGECSWPRQYGKDTLDGARVIFATQAHLERSPIFIHQLQRWAQAETVLTLLDEANFVARPLGRRISLADLERFVSVLEELRRQDKDTSTGYLLRLCHHLLDATTKDLRLPTWRVPLFSAEWALAVQSAGFDRYGQTFHFLAYQLQQFGYSQLTSRERLVTGDISFSIRPVIPRDCVVYSGTARPDFVRFRTGLKLSSPFQDYRFIHPDTVWYNIASRLGTRKYFKKNCRQILDLFAALTAIRLREGRRPLLVAKKVFLALCAEEMKRRLRQLGLPEVQIVTGGWDSVDLSNPNFVPLINYGVVGINRFQDFDCAYCLTSYYVNERVVNQVLQDKAASDFYIPIRIHTSDWPRRRSIRALRASDRSYDIQALASLALQQQEIDVVTQAVGRVRPFTRPREVITFQCAEHPQVSYTREFNSLGGAREFFSVPDGHQRRQLQTLRRIEAILIEKDGGLTQKQTAKTLGLSLRTVKRYWNQRVPRTL